MKKRNMLVMSMMLLVVLLIGGGTFAWFTASADPVVNEFTAGTLIMSVNEEFYECEADNVNPGDCIDKVVYFCNDGTKRMFVRVALDAAFEDELATMGVVSYEIGNGWVDGGDGFYYYETSVGPDCCTPALITQVCFDGPNMNNDYQGKGFTLTVAPEAVQATHDAYLDVWGQDVPTLTLLPEGNCGDCPQMDSLVD